MSKKIAIQGVKTAFHDVAATKFFGEDIDTVECLSFTKLCEALKNGDANYAVMAIENSIAGSLMQNYSLLQEYDFKIIGEVYLRIKMDLMALPGTKIEELTTISSHPIAIRQSGKYLKTLKGVNIEESEDTAFAAKEIAEKQKRGCGALASSAAAKHYGLEVLKQGVETNKANFTRFWVLAKEVEVEKEDNKASIFFQLPHDPGSLAKILNIFAEFSINLTKIQSVPIVGKPYEYNFHVDIEWEQYSNYQSAMKAVENVALNLSVLGEYQKGEYDITDI